MGKLFRAQPQGRIGLEAGASFFISDYGLRITNDSNTFVGWEVLMWHGTGWYYRNLTRCGIATLLSRATQKT
jgi:hypothetical protein